MRNTTTIPRPQHPSNVFSRWTLTRWAPETLKARREIARVKEPLKVFQVGEIIVDDFLADHGHNRVATGRRADYCFEGLPGYDEPGTQLPVDAAIDLYESVGFNAAMRFMRAAVRKDLRDIDCWAHMAILSLNCGDYRKAFEYAETGVCIAELSLPRPFDGCIRWGGMFDTRPYLRARQTLMAALWALGRTTEAHQVALDTLSLSPSDNQGMRYALTDLENGCVYPPA